MMNFMKRGLSMLLVLVLCISCLNGLTLSGSAADYVANWGVRETLATTASSNAAGFYTGDYTYDKLAVLAGGTSNATVPESALYKALQKLMGDKHTTQTSYNDTRTMYVYTDCQNGDTSSISSFYSGTAIGPDWDSGATWNREHTWPQSKGSGKDTPAGGDIIAIRPTAKSENGSRGNTAYGEASGYYDPNKFAGTTYDVRGDVARVVLYTYVRWGTAEHLANMWGTSGVMESLSVLLKWMAEDPVDTWELGRNDSVQSITGTRNVFVDYPELAFLLFNASVPTTMDTPSGQAKANTHQPANPSDPATFDHTGTPSGGEGGEGATTLEVGKPYFLYAANASGTLYFTGKLESGRITGSNTKTDGITVKLEAAAAAGEYYIYVQQGSTKNYIGTNSEASSKTAAFTLTATKDDTCIWIIDTTAKTIVSKSFSGRGIATQNDSSYTTFSTYATSNFTQAKYTAAWLELADQEYNLPASDFVKPTTVKDIMDAAYALGSGESLEGGEYELTGVVKKIDYAYNSSYGNITVTMTVTGDTRDIQCYRMGGEGVEDIVVGDTITVKGYIKNYNGTVEFDCPTMTARQATGVDDFVKPETPAEIVEAAFALADGETLRKGPYTLTGIITALEDVSDYGDRSLTFYVEGKEIYCYAVKGEVANLKVGDTITVTGDIKNYQGTVEFYMPNLDSHVPAPVDPVITYKVPTGFTAPASQSAAKGTSVTLATGVQGPALYTFLGWVTAEISDHTATAPTVLTTLTLNADTTLYAVYSVDGTYTTNPCNHTSSAVAADPGDCQNYGHAAGTKCSKCDRILTGCEKNEALGEHNYVKGDVVASTATSVGYTPYTCSVCQDEQKKDSFVMVHFQVPTGIPAVQSQKLLLDTGIATLPTAQAPKHYTFLGWVTAETDNVTTAPETVYTAYTDANAAGDVTLLALYSYEKEEVTYYTTVYVNDCLHVNTQAVDKVEPTCTEIGYEAGTYCDDCGLYTEGHGQIDALGHDYVETVVPPTAAEKGYTNHKCSRCQDEYNDTYVNALGYTVKFNVPEGVEAIADMNASDGTVLLPTVTAPDGYSFVGWVTEAVNSSAKPEGILEAGTSYAVTADTTLIALFSRQSAGGWKKVTDADSLKAGDKIYLCVTSEGKLYVAGDFVDGKPYLACTTTGATLILTLGGSKGQWTLLNAKGEALGIAQSKNAKLQWGGNNTTWDIKLDSEGKLVIQNLMTGDRAEQLRFNVNPDQERVGNYDGNKTSCLVPDVYVQTEGALVYTTEVSSTSTNPDPAPNPNPNPGTGENPPTGDVAPIFLLTAMAAAAALVLLRKKQSF